MINLLRTVSKTVKKCSRPAYISAYSSIPAKRLTRSDLAGRAARDSRVQGGAPDQSSILRERVFASSKIRILGATIDVKIRRHRKQKL